jgi:hypothetical protein
MKQSSINTITVSLIPYGFTSSWIYSTLLHLQWIIFIYCTLRHWKYNTWNNCWFYPSFQFCLALIHTGLCSKCNKYTVHCDFCFSHLLLHSGSCTDLEPHITQLAQTQNQTVSLHCWLLAAASITHSLVMNLALGLLLHSWLGAAASCCI